VPSKVKINGVEIEVPDGASISIVNGDVRIGGKTVGSAKDNYLAIDITGNVMDVTVDQGDVSVAGTVRDVNAGGSVVVHGDVAGGIDAGGSVTCETVHGDVDCGGSVACGKIAGSVDAGGSVISR